MILNHQHFPFRARGLFKTGLILCLYFLFNFICIYPLVANQSDHFGADLNPEISLQKSSFEEESAEISAFQKLEAYKKQKTLILSGAMILLFLLAVVLWKLLNVLKAFDIIKKERLALSQVCEHHVKELSGMTALIEKERQLYELKKERLNNLLDYKNRQLTTNSLIHENLIERFNKVHQQLVEVRNEKPHLVQDELDEAIGVIRPILKASDGWQSFQKHFESVHPKFFSNLREKGFGLTDNELKHCAYAQMQLSNKEVATIYGISPDSVKVARRRIKKKLNLKNDVASLSSCLQTLSLAS